MLEEQLNQLYEGYGYRKFRMSKFEDYDLYAQNKDFLKKGHIGSCPSPPPCWRPSASTAASAWTSPW